MQVSTDTISAMSQAIDALAKKAGAAAVQYGPEALHIAQQYLHAMAILSVIGDVVQILFALAIGYAWLRLWRFSSSIEDEFGQGLARVFGTIFAAALVISLVGTAI